jgi:hypothetical protein
LEPDDEDRLDEGRGHDDRRAPLRRLHPGQRQAGHGDDEERRKIADERGQLPCGGEADLGERTYNMDISSLDPTSSKNPLASSSSLTGISHSWGPPSIGQIREYRIYRSDPAHPAATFLRSVDPILPAITPLTTFDDPVNDFTHSRESCPDGMTCYNTTYTYYITTMDVHGTTSGASNSVSSEVTHLFVLPDNKVAVFNAPLPPLTFTVYGHIAGTLSGVTCAYAIAPSVPRNVGTYVIVCSGPASTSLTDGVSYNVPYNDGVSHVPGVLTITKR